MTIAEKFQTIAEKQQAVYDKGYFNGEMHGLDSGIEQGKEEERQKTWDAIQEGGARTVYEYGFYRWHLEGILPIYDIRPTTCAYMFRGCKGKFTDLSTQFEECVITFDTSKATSFNWMFYASNVTRVPVINTTSASNLDSIFYECKYLETIDGIVLKNDGSQNLTNLFTGCTALKHLTITGTIGKNFDIKTSPLVLESALSICRALVDYALENTYVYTVYFHADVLEMLGNTYYDNSGVLEGIGENELTWLDYIDVIGWRT